ncbi:MAG: hypothetical protein ACPG7W_09515, partial [Paracoccaceae bacterium]
MIRAASIHLFTGLLAGLARVSRYGRYALVLGLVAGVLLPGVAAGLQPWLPQLVMVLLGLVALRIGPHKARQGLRNSRATFALVLAFQLALPLGALGVAHLLGVAQSIYTMAVVLVLAAPALSGSPSLSIILRADPEPAFRLLIVGIVLLPLTIIPVFWMLPQVGDLFAAMIGALRMLGVILISIGFGFVMRVTLCPQPTALQEGALDGVMVIALGVMVVGLMAALPMALRHDPLTVAFWMALAFGVNFGAQILTHRVVRSRFAQSEAVPVSIVSGNRNVAIFLVALAPSVSEPLLIFLGCYQVPMYLTP